VLQDGFRLIVPGMPERHNLTIRLHRGFGEEAITQLARLTFERFLGALPRGSNVSSADNELHVGNLADELNLSPFGTARTPPSKAVIEVGRAQLKAETAPQICKRQ
jgi:hypothetical protein